MQEFAFLFCFINLILLSIQLSRLKRRWLLAVVIPSVLLLVLLFYPTVINQRISSWYSLIADKAMLGNLALFFSIEALLGIFISLQLLFPGGTKEKLWKALAMIPGPSILISLAGIEIIIFFSVYGFDFMNLAIITGLSIAIVIAALAFIIAKTILPEHALEYRLGIHGLQMVIAILLSTSYWSVPVTTESKIEWKPLLLMVVLIGFGAVCGFFIKQIKENRNKW